jgi:hypothetical protein
MDQLAYIYQFIRELAEELPEDLQGKSVKEAK